ncbi:MAG TPA: M28 family peptidase [Baekduia sp.]|uniref:M28 family peptidase n=1 Tax=Baekduia sp. TaxID=2600305 RepID=UPI002D0E5D6C|nr:M28 family peptidase [Baekduia sp.]HMJ35583.1 M28 family peptidase [Baekduia sp.]
MSLSRLGAHLRRRRGPRPRWPPTVPLPCTRASGTRGFDQSRDYVVGQLRNAGYAVNVQPFTFPYFQELAPSTFERTAPTARTYEHATDFNTMDFSGSGDVTGDIVPIDLVLPPGPTPSSNTSGCEAADFAGFPAGAVALVQRGTCTFGAKAQNAKTAGASAVVIFNEGQPGRTEALSGTLGDPIDIPVVGTSFDVGNELADLAQAGTTTVHVTTSTLSENRATYNVIADAPSGRADHTVAVGSHLDSVVAGPGINDDGSGTSQDLEMALQYAKAVKNPTNHLRFLFFGAEEEGLLGSAAYVASLSQDQTDEIMAMLDFDMMASPNFARFVYDGDGSDFPGNEGPTGSDIIESLFTGYWAGRGLASGTIPFDGRSDSVAFTDAGIPSGGIFAGAEGIKSEEQVAKYGGTAGVAYDKCYHQACDTLANLNTQAMGQFADNAANATARLVMRDNDLTDNTETLKAKRTTKSQDFKGPQLVR